MNRHVLKATAAVAILLATVVFFVDYFVKHPSVRQQLERISPGVVALLLLLYFGTVAALALINYSTLRLCKLRLDFSENLLLTAYSSVINFFGPLQSGPAFRAVYVKKKYDLNLKNYAAATLVYYFFFASFSGLFLLSGVLRWWLVPLIIVGLVVMTGLRYSRWLKPRLDGLDLRAWYYLALATFLQVSLVATIYYTELHSIDPRITLSQAIIYTGAANFALFVSITPGAIGFRESFLVFSERLHHIGATTIVAANIIDRTMYIILLLIMAVCIFATHAQRQLKAVDKKD